MAHFCAIGVLTFWSSFARLLFYRKHSQKGSKTLAKGLDLFAHQMVSVGARSTQSEQAYCVLKVLTFLTPFCKTFLLTNTCSVTSSISYLCTINLNISIFRTITIQVYRINRIIPTIRIPILAVLDGVFLREPVVGRVVETILREIQVKHFVPSVAGEIVGVVDTAEIRIRVGFGQRIAPRVINRVRDYLAVFVYGKQRTAKVAGAIPYFAYIVCSKVTLQVFAALTALCTGCIAVLCGDSGAVLIVHITLREAAVLCYQYITVSRRKIVHNIVLCYGFKVALEGRAYLGFPCALPEKASVHQEVQIVRAVRTVLQVGVCMTGVLVVAHLYILNACIERIVSVGAALAVLGLAGFQLVLCRVGILGRAVRCSLLNQIARRVIGIRGRTVLTGLACQTVLQVVGVSVRTIGKQIARKVVGILRILAFNIGADKLICLGRLLRRC